MKYIQLSWECKLSVLRRAYFAEILIDSIAGCAIMCLWQHFGNRKSVSQNKMCK